MKGKKHSKLRQLQDRANNDGGNCERCGRLTAYLTVDHIVPNAFVVMIGLQIEARDHDWNFQLLCRSCNKLKGGLFDFTNPRTLPNLKRYVEEAEKFYNL